MPRPSKKPIGQKLKRKQVQPKQPIQRFEVPNGFITVSQATQALRSEGSKATEVSVGQWVDKGLLSGARSLRHAQHPRILESTVVERMIENHRHGNKPYLGLMPKKATAREVSEHAREIGARIRRERIESEAEWDRIGPNIEKNQDAIAELRRELYLRDDIPPLEAFQVDRIIKNGLALSPAQFKKKIIPLVQAALNKKHMVR